MFRDSSFGSSDGTNELAALILARQALHGAGVGGIFGASTKNCYAADVGRFVDTAGHELLLDLLSCYTIWVANPPTHRLIP